MDDTEEMKKALIEYVIRVAKDENATDAQLSAMTSVASALINSF
jgi:hypothetical protein